MKLLEFLKKSVMDCKMHQKKQHFQRVVSILMVLMGLDLETQCKRETMGGGNIPGPPIISMCAELKTLAEKGDKALTEGVRDGSVWMESSKRLQTA